MTDAGKEKGFDAFRDQWWDPKGGLFSLHKINPLRFGYFSSHAGGLAGKTVLDIGCGGGLLSESFAKAGSIVTGIDLSPVSIEAAKAHAQKQGLNIDYVSKSPSEFSKENPEKAFDIIACSEVIEHVHDLKGFLRDSLKMLKPEGLFFFSTINKTLKARVLAIWLAEGILNMIPKGAHDYNRFVRPSELYEILRENQVVVKEIKGMTYDPLSLSFNISDDTSVNYLGFAVKDRSTLD
jgi:2-polyprenyl-6-hydroxyphenyl methylase/3-demethylubiquinone-9 3-methyltransferase